MSFTPLTRFTSVYEQVPGGPGGPCNIWQVALVGSVVGWVVGLAGSGLVAAETPPNRRTTII